MKLRLSILVVLFSLPTIAQTDFKNLQKELVEEAKKMYATEIASWYGPEFLFQKADRSTIDGYFSYHTQSGANCVFYKMDAEKLNVIATIEFDTAYSIASAKIDTRHRMHTPLELDILTIRNTAFNQLHSDTLFKTPADMTLNVIPVISDNEKKVYVITEPKNPGVIIFGNDYLLTFDENNRIKEKKALHKEMLVIPYEERSDSSAEIVTQHKHVSDVSDLITVSDICTLMLYEKLTNWNTHHVFSDKYISTWNCLKDELVIISREGTSKGLKDKKK